MTESALYLTSNLLPKERRKVGSVGVSIGTQVMILDTAGEPLPAGRTGEVVVRGPNVISAYEKDIEGERAAFTSGWLHTGIWATWTKKAFFF
jgi:long-subunit acyl-CoA synthetase (AMP-forming)